VKGRSIDEERTKTGKNPSAVGQASYKATRNAYLASRRDGLSCMQPRAGLAAPLRPLAAAIMKVSWWLRPRLAVGTGIYPVSDFPGIGEQLKLGWPVSDRINQTEIVSRDGSLGLQTRNADVPPRRHCCSCCMARERPVEGGVLARGEVGLYGRRAPRSING